MSMKKTGKLERWVGYIMPIHWLRHWISVFPDVTVGRK